MRRGYWKNAPKYGLSSETSWRVDWHFSTKCHCRQTNPRYRVEEIDQLFDIRWHTQVTHNIQISESTWLPTFTSFINSREVSNEKNILQFYFYLNLMPINVMRLFFCSCEWIECLRAALTIGPLPQPCAVQACSLSRCRLHGSSLSTTKNRWVELEFRICTPSNHRPKLVIIPVMRPHSVMEHVIKKENKNDLSNLISQATVLRAAFRGLSKYGYALFSSHVSTTIHSVHSNTTSLLC